MPGPATRPQAAPRSPLNNPPAQGTHGFRFLKGPQRNKVAPIGAVHRAEQDEALAGGLANRPASRETDAVIAPTADGGYALLGLRRFDASLFADIAWSTSTVATTTMAFYAATG